MSNFLLPHGLYSLWNSPGQNTTVGSLSLLQGIFPTQILNPGLPHHRRILYQLSYQGIPQRDTFITIDGPTLTQCSHTKSVVYITVHCVMLHIL